MAKHTDNPENEGENLNEGNNGDDNFGLPDLDYKPLDSTDESTTIPERGLGAGQRNSAQQ